MVAGPSDNHDDLPEWALREAAAHGFEPLQAVYHVEGTPRVEDAPIVRGRGHVTEGERIVSHLGERAGEAMERLRAIEQTANERMAQAEAAEKRLRNEGERIERFLADAERRFSAQADYLISVVGAAANQLETRAEEAKTTLDGSWQAASRMYERITEFFSQMETLFASKFLGLTQRLEYAEPEIARGVEKMLRRANQGIGRLAQARGELRKEVEDLLRSTEAMTERLKNEIEAVKAKHSELVEMVGDRV